MEDQGAALLPVLARQLRRGVAENPDRFCRHGEEVLPRGPHRTGCTHGSATAAVAGDRYRPVPLPASGDRSADRARQQPRARRVQGWMRPLHGVTARPATALSGPATPPATTSAATALPIPPPARPPIGAPRPASVLLGPPHRA